MASEDGIGLLVRHFEALKDRRIDWPSVMSSWTSSASPFAPWSAPPITELKSSSSARLSKTGS